MRKKEPSKGGFYLPPVAVGAAPLDRIVESATLHAKLRGPPNLALPAAEALIKLPANGCRWPIGETRSADFTFCGAPRAGEKASYCETHMDRAVSKLPLPRLRGQ